MKRWQSFVVGVVIPMLSLVAGAYLRGNDLALAGGLLTITNQWILKLAQESNPDGTPATEPWVKG